MAPRATLLLPCLLLLSAAGALEGVPKILLGTGGGGGGFNAPLWLSAGGQGFNTALSYCYQQFTPQCSHVAIANALAAAGGANASFIATKVEPEDFGPTALLTGPSRILDRDVLAEINLRSVGALMWHQAGRAAAAGNFRPPCFNASAAGPGGPGAYAACRVQGYGAFLDAQKAGAVRYIGVSNYEIRDLQQLYDAFGVWPQVLEIEVHPYYHPDALIDFALSKGIYIFNYAPLAVGAKYGLLSDPAVLAVAAAHPGALPAQVVLQWGLQRTNGTVLPRSTSAQHMAQNLAVPSMGLQLSADEMAALAALPQKKLYNTGCFPWC